MNAYPNFILPSILICLKEKTYNLLTYVYSDFLLNRVEWIDLAYKYKDKLPQDTYVNFQRVEYDQHFENNPLKNKFNYPLFRSYLEVIEETNIYTNPRIEVERETLDSIYSMDKKSFLSSLKELVDKNIISSLEVQQNQKATFILNEESLYNLIREKAHWEQWRLSSLGIFLFSFPIFPSLFKKIKTSKYILLSYIIKKIELENAGIQTWIVDPNAFEGNQYGCMNFFNEKFQEEFGFRKSNLNKCLYDLSGKWGKGMITVVYNQHDEPDPCTGTRRIFINEKNRQELEYYTKKDGFKFPSIQGELITYKEYMSS